MDVWKNLDGRYNKDPYQTSRGENYNVWDEKYNTQG